MGRKSDDGWSGSGPKYRVVCTGCGTIYDRSYADDGCPTCDSSSTVPARHA